MRAQICLPFIALIFALSVNFITCDFELENFTEAKFAAKILHLLPDIKKSNQLFSPSSLRRSFGIMRIGASGQTSKDLAKFGEFKGDNNKVTETMSDALKDLKSVKLISGYYSQERKIHHLFRERLETKWGFQRYSEFRASMINKMIETSTDEKIQSFIRPKDINDKTTQLTVDILKFSSKWEKPFTKALTENWNNGTLRYDAEVYAQENNFLYGEFTPWKARAIILPFKDGQTEMLLLLPRIPQGLNGLLEALKKVDITKIKSKLKKEKVRVYLPKLREKSPVPVKKILEKTEVEKIFTDEGRFMNLVHSLDPYVNTFQHSTLLECSMMELNALAVTSIIWKNKRNPVLDTEPDEEIEADNVAHKVLQRIIMDLDHPFFYAIIAGDNILFEGVIRNV